MARTDRKWTKARVLKAYSEWHNLERHLEDVIGLYCRATGTEFDGFDRLHCPDWWGTGWPGDNVEWSTFDANYCQSEYTASLPMEYLWTDAWEKELRQRHEAWLATAEAAEQERAERAVFERLKAKFAEPADG